jgi:hypothetical protein
MCRTFGVQMYFPKIISPDFVVALVVSPMEALWVLLLTPIQWEISSNVPTYVIHCKDRCIHYVRDCLYI